MVALATMLAVDVGFRGFLDQRRSATLFALDQGYEVALGAEAWAADFLKRDQQESRRGTHWESPHIGHDNSVEEAVSDRGMHRLC